MALHKLSLCELQKRFTAGEVTAVEIVRAYALRIGQVESKVKAYVTQVKDAALQHAAELDGRLKGWRKTRPLTGMPLAVKDNLCTEAVPTTCASRMLQHFVPPYDATVIAKLRDQDYILLGKTNLDEFAMGSSTEHSAFGPSRNPWNLHCVPGGSSGGSAAAVAADECVAALGSDTGGSIRQPAAFCGVVGLKPTYGAVSRYGVVAFASSLDQVGPFALTVRDVGTLLSIIARDDPRDSTNTGLPAPVELPTGGDLKGLRLAVPRDQLGAGVEPGVAALFEQTVELCRSLGAEVGETTLPHASHGLAAYYLIAPSEASANLARYDGVRYGLRVDAPDVHEMYNETRRAGFGAEVKRRIMIGTYA